jgi:hypothetical protein
MREQENHTLKNEKEQEEETLEMTKRDFIEMMTPHLIDVDNKF